ncbi:MAG: MerR family transcriptional regulator [Dissulfuribacterales bacterium]
MKPRERDISKSDTASRVRGSTPDPSTPIYPIGVAARILNVHPRTLRLYEAEGFIKPSYVGPRRLFSQNDMDWIACLRSMIHDEGISMPGLKRLLGLVPCWEIANCPCEVRQNCKVKFEKMSSLQCTDTPCKVSCEGCV